MKRTLLVLSALATALLLPACHDHDDRHSDNHAHTTTTSTTESSSMRMAPAGVSSTTVRSY